MPRNVFYRDFTICKAVALVALMGLALMLGVPDRQQALTDDETTEAMLIPAAVYSAWTDCDPAQAGVEL
ncbi:hypothetical protein [Maliponia aquimaris]|nr:hypothetical protein [Maliponia aquimaris]